MQDVMTTHHMEDFMKDEQGDYMKEQKEEKPLNVWFEKFLMGIKEFDVEYSSVNPLDMLELYYEGIPADDAASRIVKTSKKVYYEKV